MGVDANGPRDDRFRGGAGETRSGSRLSGHSSASGQHCTLQTSDSSASPRILAFTVSNTSHDIAAFVAAICSIALLRHPGWIVTANTVTDRPGMPCAAQRRAVRKWRYGRHDRCGRFNWNGLLLLSALTLRFRCRSLRRPYPRPFAPLLLAFPRLPVTHFPQTFRGLTAGLIPGGGEKRLSAPFSYTIPRWKARFPRRTRIVGAKFHVFHGRSCSPWIRPNGCSEPFGHFF